MKEYVYFALHGKRDVVEKLHQAVGSGHPIVDMPGGSTLDFELLAGTPQYALAENLINEYGIRPFRRSRIEATSEELATEELFSCYGCSWTDDQYKIVVKPAYSGRDACPNCGKGGTDLLEPLQVFVRKLKGAHLVRVPPGLFLVSAALAELTKERGWTGAAFENVIDRDTKVASEAYRRLVIQSILPPMHSSAPIVPNGWPTPCNVCRKLGFKLDQWQAVYSRDVMSKIADWNVSAEWLAPHAVSCPELICPRHVVHELLKMESSQNWIPVRLLD